MEVTRLSSKGQVIIPKAMRTAHRWETGQELLAIDMGDGILLKPKNPFSATTLQDIMELPAYSGTPKTVEEMHEAVQEGILEEWRDRSRH